MLDVQFVVVVFGLAPQHASRRRGAHVNCCYHIQIWQFYLRGRTRLLHVFFMGVVRSARGVALQFDALASVLARPVAPPVPAAASRHRLRLGSSVVVSLGWAVRGDEHACAF